MEWKSNLRRAQSLKSIPSSCDRPAWPDARLLDRKASVSQLVARYQTTKEAGASFRATSRDNGEAKPPRHETAASPPQPRVNVTAESPETHPETLTWRNEGRKPSHVKPGFGRSQSMGALNSTSGSIGSLRALFESKGATQNKPRAATKATHSSSTVVMNLRAEETSTEQQGTQTPAETSVDGAKTAAQAESVSHKVVSHSRSERRRTIGGVDFERVAASQADEKRRSIADFRDSFLNQKQEKPCVSVKAISALYLSKVAPQEPQHRVARDQSSESGKRVKFTKMAEDSQTHKDDHPPIPSPRHQLGAVDNRAALSQPSKEMLHQQRQKCELRRLLKHTHPELKMLDRVVDEELAEVLSAETAAAAEAGAAAAETGYEGEVLSRRLIFENCATSNKVSPYSRKMHMAEESAERGDVGRTSAVLEQLEERPCAANTEADKTLNPDPSRECEEEIVRIDVQATRRLFESQSVKASRPNPENKLQGKVAISGDEAGALQKQKTGLETCSTQHHNRPEKQGWCAVNQSTAQGLYAKEEVFDDEPANPPDPEGEPIKTSLSLFQNNPFIAKNVEKENAYVHTAKPHFPAAADNADAEDYPADNVKNRAHLFESMPFDKIRRQNKDEVETMVEKIKESLSSLHRYKAVRSHGSIIEVNETVRAKKAKFTLSERGPEIDYDTVAEGNSQNFILHLLPRVNLKPQLTYLKEDKKGNMEAMAVNVPVHHRQFATNQDTECKTANVAQLVEDILNQDNSLRKGVIIQEGADRCADVVVYSLYNYMDEEDVRRYSPGEARMERRPSDEETPVLSTKEASWDQTSMEPIKSEVAVKGNVKLFKSCIEKGELDYLKSLQDEPADEDPPSEQHTPAEEGPTEWVPVDVKKLKSMFSGDSNPPLPKQCTYKLPTQATAAPQAKVQCEQSSTESDIECFKECGVQGGVNPALWPFEPQPDDGIHQAELVEVVDEADEMMTLQAAIQNLQQATNEAKAFHNSLQEKHKLARGSSEPPNPNMETRNQLAEVVQKEQHLETALASSNRSEATAAPQEQKQEQEEEEEVVFEGKLQAALDSLQKSNINVSRGDFRAAMIYRGSSKAAGAVQKPGELHPESTKKQGEAAEEVTKDKVGGLQTNSAPLKKNRTPSGPKPAIPPKPEHLKMKQDSSAEIHPTKSNSDGGECKEDQIQGSGVAMEINNADKTAKRQREETNPQEIPAKENLGETDETPVDFKEAVKKFGGKKAAKVAPVKPKRVKIAQPEQKNTQPASEQSNVIASVDAEPQQSPDSGQKADGKEVRGESKVELREKKRRAETEDERRQRLSVHMDEIMRGNIGAAMEIFDNLRKQEELQSILSRVEEIEEDTSEVDVRSLRRVFEDVPDWVVDGNQRKARTVRAEHKEEPQTKESAESKSSMAHVFGDLERASAEIMNLKEQTLARLVDIEEAIKKALYSVSTLKSDSDIAGLSSLFKESMQGTPASGNISKISIGSSRTKPASEQEVTPTQGGAAPPSRPRASPPSSPAFISIQSAARKSEKAEAAPQESCPTCQHSPRPEEKFRTTKTLQCNSPAPSRRQDPRGGGQKQPAPSPANQRRELAVLEVQTDRQGAAGVLGTKTVTENYERTDDSGNRFYSSKTSTVVTTQPPTLTTSTGHMIISCPPTNQVSTYPEVHLPINYKP